MKIVKTLAVVAVVGIALGGLAVAQIHRGGGGHGSMHGMDSAAATQHLTEGFAKVVPFDVNKDGKLDAMEKESLGKAIADGTVQLPAHTPPNGIMPGSEAMLDNIAAMYAFLVRLDGNHDGALDTAEQAALKSAIEKGDLASLHQHH